VIAPSSVAALPDFGNTPLLALLPDNSRK
jgi:hypothetical protein